MEYWTFTSQSKWFSFDLPANWSEYDDGDETYAFFNTGKWSGNLRLTPFRWSNTDTDKAVDSVEKELAGNEHAVSMTLNGRPTAFYSKKIDEETMVYYWQTGLNNSLFLCSFSFDAEFLSSPWHNAELDVVENMLNSIRVLN